MTYFVAFWKWIIVEITFRWGLWKYHDDNSRNVINSFMELTAGWDDFLCPSFHSWKRRFVSWASQPYSDRRFYRVDLTWEARHVFIPSHGHHHYGMLTNLIDGEYNWSETKSFVDNNPAVFMLWSDPLIWYSWVAVSSGLSDILVHNDWVYNILYGIRKYGRRIFNIIVIFQSSNVEIEMI